MKIDLKKITIRDLTNGYKNHAEEGVVAYGGKLNVRPPYQREFIYKDQQRNAVIDTITNNFPLNVMYWAIKPDGNFEIIDGQQRTMSVCEYVTGNFSVDNLFDLQTRRGFENLSKDEQEKILNYELQIYICDGDDSEKLKWFKTINIAGEKLTDQELNNAIYWGSWVTDAKRYFSKTSCPAYNLGNKYLNGKSIRQDYLEAVIDWVSNGDIEGYMAKHQHDSSADDLWIYFQNVINWVQAKFSIYRQEMRGVAWGKLYNQFKDKKLDSKKMEEEIATLMEDEDVENKKGIYEYILTREEKHLNLRAFSDKQKREAYERQKGKCIKCKEHFKIEEMEADHITPWSEGGKTIPQNCQMLCKEDNRRKSNK